jgi:hypothetical protein
VTTIAFMMSAAPGMPTRSSAGMKGEHDDHDAGEDRRRALRHEAAARAEVRQAGRAA